VEEPRYDAETLKKVTALAQELQNRHQQTFTAHEMEEIGSEVGLERSFIRRALGQFTATSNRLTQKTAVEARKTLGPARTESVSHLPAALLKAFSSAWWSAGWMLPLLGAILGSFLRLSDRDPGFL